MIFLNFIYFHFSITVSYYYLFVYFISFFNLHFKVSSFVERGRDTDRYIVGGCVGGERGGDGCVCVWGGGVDHMRRRFTICRF